MRSSSLPYTLGSDARRSRENSGEPQGPGGAGRASAHGLAFLLLPANRGCRAQREGERASAGGPGAPSSLTAVASLGRVNEVRVQVPGPRGHPWPVPSPSSSHTQRGRERVVRVRDAFFGAGPPIISEVFTGHLEKSDLKLQSVMALSYLSEVLYVPGKFWKRPYRWQLRRCPPENISFSPRTFYGALSDMYLTS